MPTLNSFLITFVGAVVILIFLPWPESLLAGVIWGVCMGFLGSAASHGS